MDRVTLPLRLGGLVAANLLGQQTAPVVMRPLIVPALRRTFGRVRVLEWWDGEEATYARLRTRDGRALFLKYRPALNTRERPYRRFRNEELYLRTFAPRVSIPHAALLHAAHHDPSRKAHLVLEDLSERTLGWSDLSERERDAQLPNVMALIARYHAAWLNNPRLELHPSFPWSPADWAERARRGFAQKIPHDLMGAGTFPAEVLETVRGLSGDSRWEAWLARSELVTLVHGDLHFEQVLFDRAARDHLYLIDYQHTRVAPLGVDLAHLLAVRFSWLERRHLQGALQGAYLRELQECGVALSDEALRREYALGLLLNFLAVWERFVRDPTPLFKDLVLRVHAALEDHWDELYEHPGRQ